MVGGVSTLWFPRDKTKDTRITRMVYGAYCDFDDFFDRKEKDFLNNVVFTNDNFDKDDVYFITPFGYTTEKSLMDMGIVGVEISIYPKDKRDPIKIENLIFNNVEEKRLFFKSINKKGEK